MRKADSWISINLREGTSQLLFVTVRVEMLYADGAVGSGTAFFFGDFHSFEEKPASLVTNRHVVADAASLRLRFHVSPNNDPSLGAQDEVWIEMTDPENLWTPHPNEAVDLCAISVKRLNRLGLKDAYFSSILESRIIPTADDLRRCPALMNLLMIGYPSGLWDEPNNLPILRRGTTASHPGIDFNGLPEVVIDMACFPGSSGSPVVLYDRDYFGGVFRFLGVLYAGPVLSSKGEITVNHIPTQATAFAVIPTMIHLGYVIKARKVQELVRHVEQVESNA